MAVSLLVVCFPRRVGLFVSDLDCFVFFYTTLTLFLNLLPVLIVIETGSFFSHNCPWQFLFTIYKIWWGGLAIGLQWVQCVNFNVSWAKQLYKIKYTHNVYVIERHSLSLWPQTGISILPVPFPKKLHLDCEFIVGKDSGLLRPEVWRRSCIGKFWKLGFAFAGYWSETLFLLRHDWLFS